MRKKPTEKAPEKEQLELQLNMKVSKSMYERLTLRRMRIGKKNGRIPSMGAIAREILQECLEKQDGKQDI